MSNKDFKHQFEFIKKTNLARVPRHFGLRLSGPTALQKWKAHLSQQGVLPGAEYNHGGNYQSFFVRDPEGNDLEFFVEH